MDTSRWKNKHIFTLLPPELLPPMLPRQGNGITILLELQSPLGNPGDLITNSFRWSPSPTVPLHGLLFYPMLLPFPFPKQILEVQPIASLTKLLTNLPDPEVFQANPF